MNCTPHILVLARTYTVSNGNAGSDGESDEQVDKKIDNCTAGSDRCNGDTSAESSDDNKVSCIEKEL